MIPPEFHYIWLQGESQLPDDLQRLKLGCQLANPGVTFRVWDSAAIDAVLARVEPTLYEVCKQRNMPLAQISDIARYVIVREYGGVYVDADYECWKGLHSILSAPHVDLFYVPFADIAGLRVMNGLFGAVAGHPLLHMVVAEMKARLGTGPKVLNTVTFTTGTRLFFDCIKAYHTAYPNDDRYIILSHLQLFPCNVWQNADACNAQWHDVGFMTHHNQGSWMPSLFGIIKVFTHTSVQISVLCVVLLAVCVGTVLMLRS